MWRYRHAAAGALFMTLLATPGSDAVDTFRPVLRGLHGAVAAGGPLAVEAGMRLLRDGGNAVDAGVAATFAAAVTEFSHFGLGGEASILYYMQSGDRVVAVNADGPAPMLATPERFAGKQLLPCARTAPSRSSR
jgi:gamma-glutamyltranspeptidase/glutathione hydrolase